MNAEEEPILDSNKMLEKISKIENASQNLLSAEEKLKKNNDLLLTNKEFINYLYEHQNVKDLNFFMLYPNMNITSIEKKGIFHETQRKDCVQYIQKVINECSKNKKTFESNINDIKKNLLNLIEDPSEVELLEKEVYELMFPLIAKKFPTVFKVSEDEIEID